MPTEDKPSSTPWIVQGDAVRSGEVTAFASRGRDIREIRRLGSDIVVLSMPRDQVENLRSAFPNRVVVEPDQELKMFGAPAAPSPRTR